VHVAAAHAGEQACAGPDQGQQYIGERRVSDGDGAPQQKRQDDQSDELTRAWAAELDIQRDFCRKTDEESHDVQADVQKQHED
jgi:hypothetical protein